jgi:hypothetical protein
LGCPRGKEGKLKKKTGWREGEREEITRQDTEEKAVDTYRKAS